MQECSKEEIERKKALALKLRQKSTQSTSSPFPKNITNNSTNQNVVPNVGNNSHTNYNRFNSYKNTNSKPYFKNGSKFSSSQSKSQSSFKQQNSNNRYNPISTKQFYDTKNCEASCSMISDNRFSVNMSVYNKQLIELFKTIPSRLYDVTTKVWNFHLNDYDTVQEKIIRLDSSIQFIGLPSYLLTTFKNLLKKEKELQTKIDLSPIDSTLLDSLYPFQKEGVEYGILKNGRVLIADDMGLGKTKQALGIAHYYKNDWPLLIITPSSVKYQWSQAVIENITSIPVQSVQHITTTRDVIEGNLVTIMSYDLLVRRIDEIAARKFGVVICDESHYLKSIKTQRTKAVQRLGSSARRLIFLSGTPALSRPIELHSQIKILMPNFMGYVEFGMRYCAGIQTNYGWDFQGSSNLKELEILLKACCIIRRLKSDVLTQLPSKIREKVILDPYLIKASTKEMEAASKNMEKNNMSSSQKHSALLEYYSVSSKAKEKAVCNYITDLIENEEKFLVFGHHKNMLDAISNLLTSKKILFIRIDGKTNPEHRKEFVDMFQQNDKILVAVLSITAANAGITLTAARLVIFAELTWNPGILCQAEDRVHRIGQTENVVIRYLLAKETADDYLWPAIQKKIDVLNEVGLDQSYDLDKANLAVQMPSYKDQASIEDFLDTSFTDSKSLKSTQNLSGNAKLSASPENLKDLLDVDDDAFNDIDLDNIEC